MLILLGIGVVIIIAVLLVFAVFAAVAVKKSGAKLPGLSAATSRVAEIIKISTAGGIFLVLIYILAPDFVKTYHKEITIMIVAMIVSAGLLGINHGWEESSTRKILRAHFMALTIILFGVVILQEADKRGFFVSLSPPQAVAPAVDAHQLCGNYDLSNLDIKKVGQITVAFRPDCWVGVTLPRNIRFSSEPSVDVWMLWADGTKYIDGPNRLIPGVNNRRIFHVLGFLEHGNLKITFEEKFKGYERRR